MNDDIRWKQRFSNYKKALSHLTSYAEFVAFEQTMERLQ